jgi:hypothetical protein
MKRRRNNNNNNNKELTKSLSKGCDVCRRNMVHRVDDRLCEQEKDEMIIEN